MILRDEMNDEMSQLSHTSGRLATDTDYIRQVNGVKLAEIK